MTSRTVTQWTCERCKNTVEVERDAVPARWVAITHNEIGTGEGSATRDICRDCWLTAVRPVLQGAEVKLHPMVQGPRPQGFYAGMANQFANPIREPDGK